LRDAIATTPRREKRANARLKDWLEAHIMSQRSNNRWQGRLHAEQPFREENRRQSTLSYDKKQGSCRGAIPATKLTDVSRIHE
jgi:hypothetical protein